MKIALRIGYHRYYDDAVFAQHLEFIRRNADIIDEVTIFAEFSHYGYWPIQTSRDNAALLKQRIAAYREAGVPSVGINLLCTIGHMEESWDVLPRAPLPYLVDEHGVASKSCLCPSDPAFLEYTADRYAVYAQTGADFLWIDDDLRPCCHGSVNDLCFCDGCIRRFNQANHTAFSREELVQRINSDPAVQAAWEAWKHDVIASLCEVIEKAVHTANPAMEIGYMSCYLSDRRDWVVRSGAVKGRPGGGFYTDATPIDLFSKMFSIKQQLRSFPDYIKDLQYEYEAFNYQTLEKSMHISELETTLSLMAGCNGALYNNIFFCDRQDLLDTLRTSRAKWKTLTRLNEGCRPAGVYCLSTHTALRLEEISIPTTAIPENAVAAVVTGQELTPLSDAEISRLLDMHLFTDGRGLAILHQRGFGSRCGGRVRTVYDNGMAERFSGHALNGDFPHEYRDVYMNTFGTPACELEPDADAQILSHLERTTHVPGGCSMYCRESAQGIRFAVDGYLAPDSIKSAPKRAQLGNVIDWLSGNTLPVRIQKPVKVIPTVMSDDHGTMNVMLTNVSFDKTGTFDCILRGSGDWSLIDAQGALIPLTGLRTETGTVITIDNIDGWNYLLLTNRQNG